MILKPLETKELPKPLPFSKLVGPSFIILGLGLGTGELILWPNLISKFGMGIIWGAILGITFQFFMNMEIERYALARGESVFIGFARKLKRLPIWFILSTFIPWIWPGTASASATIIGNLFGLQNVHVLSIVLLILVGLILSFGSTLYKTVEHFQKWVTIFGVSFLVFLTFYLAKAEHWAALAKGSIGIGENYWFLPVGIPIASFLGALAYAGAGGNLNLAQSSYIREKGYGMGKYTGKIKGLLHEKSNEDTSITGSKFEITKESIKTFKEWWRTINKEHALIFWLTGTITILTLGLLAFTTIYGQVGNKQDIEFLIIESSKIGQMSLPIISTIFMIVVALTLFGTQLGVFDATSRIISENVILTSNKLSEKNIGNVYYLVLWAQILAGVIILSLDFRQPLQLIVISAVLNAFTMFVHVGLTLWLNLSSLEKEIRPSFFRTLVMTLAFCFYGFFSIYTIINELF
ncbi:Nramp family divalent metal transporter [candidate division WWE3 bacterium]|uniref:Nramp family divalent metal transporter n=1 Tax=candidate division WWE3 bacterium TaxID=2053526 RepID=A0A7X9HTE8_UNCKA|nr:Nramp family divalent metal transporter [candidate division WWE3 bacterium]